MNGHDGEDQGNSKSPSECANDLLEMSLNDQNYKIEDFQVKDLETSYLEYKNQNSLGHVDLDITDPSLMNQINDDLSINIG